MKQITCPHCADTYPDFDVAHVCSRGPYAPKLKPKMNERIKQLANKALKQPDTDNDGLTVFDNDELKKFTELIVRECCEVINAAKPGVVQVPAEVALDMTAKNIKAYFGVEE